MQNTLTDFSLPSFINWLLLSQQQLLPPKKMVCRVEAVVCWKKNANISFHFILFSNLIPFFFFFYVGFILDTQVLFVSLSSSLLLVDTYYFAFSNLRAVADAFSICLFKGTSKFTKLFAEIIFCTFVHNCTS